MSAADNKNKSALARSWAWCKANPHFVVACVLFGVTAIGWSLAVELLEWATHKEPVPWPEAVVVDHATFRNISLPTTIGPFKRVEDGVFQKNENGTPKFDGKPDGEHILDDEVLEPLGVGSYLDKQRVKDRCSNWYVSRVYEDTRKDSKYRFWRLGVYYYTGGQDLVPHVGEVCLAAGGAVIIGATEVRFSGFNVPDPWNGSIAFRRTISEKESRKYVQYHVFSLNGKPENNRLTVRGKLAVPWVRHSYFAKIEFAPNSEIKDSFEADDDAEEFMRHILPVVLKSLPTSEDIKRLDETKKK